MFCASAICAGVIFAAICSRPSRLMHNRMKQEGAEASAVSYRRNKGNTLH